MRKKYGNVILFLLITLRCVASQGVSVNLEKEFKKSEVQKSVLKKIKPYKLLLIQSKVIHPEKGVGDYQEFIILLKTQGFVEDVDFETVLTNGEDPVEFAARDVVASIRDSLRSVLIISSSKASADTLEALITYQGLQHKVVGFISIQGAIGGVEAAENIKRPVSFETSLRAEKMPLIQAFRFLVDYISSFSNNFSEALYSLNPSVRDVYLDQYDSNIKKLSKKVPTLFVGADKKNLLKYCPHIIVKNEDVSSYSDGSFYLKLLNTFQRFYKISK